jgi:thiol-disulfide isomerase/thioredoxin
MKKLHFSLTIIALALAAVILQSCDEIEPPYKQQVSFQGTDTVRNVVLEEFTGHLCPNCPGASAELHALKDIYGDNLILITVHAGFFAQTQSAPFDYDFSTSMGDALNAQFNIQSNPKGLVSRVKSGGKYKRDVSEWSFYVDSLINDAPKALLDMSCTYNSSNRQLDIDVSGTVLSQLDGDYNLSVVITEDSIVKPQKNNDPQLGPTPEIQDYVHMHVLRGAVNGDWGESFFSGPKDSLDVLPQKQYNYTLDASWKAKDCHVVAYFYRSDNAAGTEYEIIQATEVKVIE